MRIVQTDLLLRIDSIERSAENMSFNAWIANRRQRLTHVSILVNSKPWVTDVPLTGRPDVLEHLGDIAPYSLRSGIAILNPVNRDQISGLRDEFRIIAKQDSREMGAITCATRDFNWERSRFPLPPFELAERVGGHAGFLQTGLRLYHDIKSNVQRHCDFRCLERVLDWGCGCGRILRYALEDLPADRISACDIDAAAIAWDKANVNGPSFVQIPAVPPTSYPDDTFDLIYGISIFTHLDESTQNQWLKELRRITRPGGIVAVSVLGEPTTPAGLRPVLRARGFADVLSPQSEQLAVYSNPDYYRVTYHTSQYIQETWSKYFELIEYVEFGINSHQDLVIMKKR